MVIFNSYVKLPEGIFFLGKKWWINLYLGSSCQLPRHHGGALPGEVGSGFPQEMPKTPPGKLEKMWKRCGKHQRSTILESLFTLFPFFDIFWELPERGNSSMKERNVHIIHGICGADKNTQLWFFAEKHSVFPPTTCFSCGSYVFEGQKRSEHGRLIVFKHFWKGQRQYKQW